MFDYLTDMGRLAQMFNWPVRGMIIWRATRSDATFLRQVRTGFLPLPTDGVKEYVDPFPDFQPRDLTTLAGKRVGLIASGGSGALAALVGVARVLQEGGVQPVAYGLCSGSAFFGIPLAAGMTPEEVARETLQLRARDYIDPDWIGLATAPWKLMRGWSAVVRGEKVEETYRRILGDITLGELPTPVHLPIWNIEQNRLGYLGSDTHPDLSAARAVRMAIALPLAIQPAELDGGYWLDGGIIDILPTRPFVQNALCDAAIVVNGFYGPGLHADQEPQWREKPLSVLHVSNQTRLALHLELARRSMADLRAAVSDVIELNPVRYDKVHGAGLYGQFLDTREWPQFMADGYRAAAAALSP